MSEEGHVEEGQEQGKQVAPEVVREARNMGWAPRDKWKGDPND